MGVPKFFRYTSERYPCLNELVKQYQIPEFDNMYLDMNGIIHNCSHPDDSNPHFRITEQKIFEEIFHYISILFQIIKPKKLFFMAIDGVAPRAKMNQQRGRRFRSAKEAEDLEKKAIEKGEKLPSEKRFDSNCITPGTVFMAKLHEQLKYFVKNKISTDPLWHNCRIVLSGHETPGEGEHKIMDYIRWARSQDDYDPNTRHCLYGLDADLIMLGMCSHEPHFALLREEVKFGKTTQRSTSVEETNFYLLHLSLLRDYLHQEFISIKDKLSFEYDLEKIVDDWVLMGFLVGNDFIPNLPNMHISNDAMPVLYKTYMAVLPKLDGYINEAGDLNLARFEVFMEELSKIDTEAFHDTYADLKYFEGKTGRRPNFNERKSYKPNNDDTFNVDVEEIKQNKNADLQSLINATDDLFISDDEYEDMDECDMSDDDALFAKEFKMHKKDYYMNKLDYEQVTDEVLRSQAECYVRAIQWNLFYYYKGCPSWCWYYPHHYAPYISDIKGFKDLNIEFEHGKPFKPFEQLLGVLPAASKHLLPEPFHILMTQEQSPIVHYYPINFETDLNGKKNEWEAVVLIPFIDEKNLLDAMGPCYAQLTPEEIKRNTAGPMIMYERYNESLGRVEAPEYFPPIIDCRAMEKKIWREELELPSIKLKRGLLPNVMMDLVFPGFPTTRHLAYTTYTEKKKVKVFDQPSRNDNMIMKLTRDENKPEKLEKYRDLLGKVVWVAWPHLTQAKVIGISDESLRLHHIVMEDGKGAIKEEQNAGNLHKRWLMERSTILDHNLYRLGVEVGTVDVIIHAVNLKGYKYMITDRTQLALEPEWCQVPCGYASHTVLTDISAHVVSQLTRFATPDQLFKPNDPVFVLSGPYYGCLAKVLSSEEASRTGRIRVSLKEEKCDNVPDSITMTHNYKTSYHAAAAAGISSQLLSRLTGSILVVLGPKTNGPTEQLPKVNIGLNLKFNKKNLEVAGFTRRCADSNTWLYSQRCVDIVSEYVQKYPDLFDVLSTSMSNDVFFEADLWPGEVGSGKAREIYEWLKQQPHANAAKRPCGSEALEPNQLLELRSKHQEIMSQNTDEKGLNIQVKMTLLYKADMHQGSLLPDPQADFKLFDRVVCCSDKITVPLGYKGIITAVYHQSEVNTVRLSDKLNKEITYQVMFDEPFPGGMKEDLIEDTCFYRMLPYNMLNISYGRKLRNKERPPVQPFSYSTQPNQTYTSNDNSGKTSIAQKSNWRNDKQPNRSTEVQSNRSTYLNTPPAPSSVLKRDDARSAFASYSPTKEKASATQGPSVPSQTFTRTNDRQTQDTSSAFLKSLLKISSESDQPPENSIKNKNNLNWRKGNPPQTNKLEQPPSNWRTEKRQNEPRRITIGTDFKKHPAHGQPQQAAQPNIVQSHTSILGPPPLNLLTQLNHGAQYLPQQIPFMPQPPVLPPPKFPTPYFAAPSVPPMPRFAPPHQAQSFHRVQNNQAPAVQPIQVSKEQKKSADILSNPFVPLQAIASQRRSQTVPANNASSSHTGANSIDVKNHQNNQQNQQPANVSQKQKKRKCRIAANLPVQID